MVEGFANAAGEMPARGVSVGTPAQPLTAAETRRGRLARWAWPAGLAVAAVVLFLSYLRLSRTVPNGSDGADQVLQAWDMLHGNWLLRGWTVGDVSYYTTELPEYILVELIRGLSADVIHVAAAVTYTLLVLLAALLAKGRATGRDGVVRALIASGILLAPQLGHGIALLIQQPDHIGTQVPLLVIFIVLDRAPRRWYTPAAITVMLTWVIIANRVAVFGAALPLVAVCGLRAFRALVHDRKPLASLWFEFSLMAAGIVSFGVAALVVRAINGYTSLPLPPTRLASTAVLPAHLVLTVKGILILYGANFGGLSSGVAVAIAAVHLAGLALALWGICRAFRRFFSASDLIVPVMATGIVINLAAYTFSLVPVTWFDTREIPSVLPFGAVLAGRLLAEPLGRARLVPVLAGVLAGYVLALGYGVAQPAAVIDGEYPVVSWLEAHHLSTGLGTYVESNLITLDSGGRVAVRTVSWRPSGAVPRAFESKASWYDPRLSYANFVVINLADGHGVSLIPSGDILALAGHPAHTYRYKTFIIMVWNHNLLADLGTPATSSPGNLLRPPPHPLPATPSASGSPGAEARQMDSVPSR